MSERVSKEVGEFDLMSNTEAKLIDNSIVFPHNDKNYRVSRPTLKDKSKLRSARLKKLTELKKDPDILSEEDVKNELKGTENDFEDIEMQMKVLYKQLEEMKKKAYNSRDNEIALASIEAEADKIKKEFEILSFKKSCLLEGTLEKELHIFCLDYLTYLILEVEEEDNWVKVFSTYEEYESVNTPEMERLVTEACINASYLTTFCY